MLNTITDWIFTNSYLVTNIIVVCQVVLLVIGLIELGQDEVGELVEFYEERRNYDEKIADLNERA